MSDDEKEQAQHKKIRNFWQKELLVAKKIKFVKKFPKDNYSNAKDELILIFTESIDLEI